MTDWTPVPPENMPSMAHRHRHADGRYCTYMYKSGWIFNNDDSDTHWAMCLRKHYLDD